MGRTYHRWWSPRLRREMELLVFGHAGARVLVFPTRAGRFYDYERWGLVEALHRPLAAGAIQLYCVDSSDRESLYAFHWPPWERIARHLQYESYIVEEVLPLSQQLNPSPYLIAHGCSLGAYHAVNLAFRHPQRFRKVVALSGRACLRSTGQPTRPRSTGKKTRRTLTTCPQTLSCPRSHRVQRQYHAAARTARQWSHHHPA